MGRGYQIQRRVSIYDTGDSQRTTQKSFSKWGNITTNIGVNMKLYELTKDLQACEDMMEHWAAEHDGDITEFPFNDEMEKLELDFEAKALGIGTWIKNILSDSEAIKAEMQSLAQRKKVLDNKAGRLKAFLQDYVPKGQKHENAQCKIGWRKSQIVYIPPVLAPADLDEKYQNIKVDFSKTALKAACKEEESIMIFLGI